MTSQPTALITGCSDHGIGSGLALVFQKRGYHVFATARDPSKMTNLRDLPNVTLLTLDVREELHIARAVEAVRAHTGGTLTYLINNAGRNHFMPILDEDLGFARELFETNVWGQVAMTRAFMPLLMEAKGAVAFTTSVAGYLNVPYMGTYAASKRSIELIAETMRLELEPFHVRVMSIVTGAVKTMGQTYFGDFKLPGDSLYKPIEETIAARARGEDGRPREELMVYAEDVVSAIERGESGKIWCGENAASIKHATTNPNVATAVMDHGLSQGTGLDVLAGKHK